MTDDEMRAAQEAAASERATLLREYWTGCLDTASRSVFTREDAVVQMLAVATHAMEAAFGAEAAARCYTDQVALLLARKADDDKIVASLADAPRH